MSHILILVGQPVLGKFTTVLNFLYFWQMALTGLTWSPKALDMAVLSSPDVNYFSNGLDGFYPLIH